MSDDEIFRDETIGEAITRIKRDLDLLTNKILRETKRGDRKMDFIYDLDDQAWYNYQHMLQYGIAKEVARMCLPVSIYSSAYVTCNARSLMAFLSLRTKKDHAMFPSFPMKEINMVADVLETHLHDLFPLTWKAFNETRVSP